MQHKTVLLHEAVEALALKSNSVVLDATLGSGGHAREIISHLGKDGHYIGLDADQSAIDQAGSDITKAKPQVDLINTNFSEIRAVLSSLNVEYVDAVLADLGWRMEQFSDGAKGFSFNHDGPLNMTFGDPQDYPFTASDIINEWDEKVLADIFFGYGEERFARRIAKAVVTERKKSPIATTFELVKVIESAIPAVAKRKRLHPATKTFQALRIAVNDELEVLEKFIKETFDLLAINGRLAIITFHSIEDRIVKHLFRELQTSGSGLVLTKKPIEPSEDELNDNPRARSAKLRIITRVV